MLIMTIDQTNYHALEHWLLSRFIQIRLSNIFLNLNCYNGLLGYCFQFYINLKYYVYDPTVETYEYILFRVLLRK